MWMTMRIINTLVLNLTSMVLMVDNATMANNEAIMNIFNKLKSNHNMVHHIW
jgi:signal recognition particle receptor subunit beta